MVEQEGVTTLAAYIILARPLRREACQVLEVGEADEFRDYGLDVVASETRVGQFIPLKDCARRS